MQRLLDWLEKPINLLLWVGLVAGLLMMLHVTVDVAGRTIFNHPLEGTTEIVVGLLHGGRRLSALGVGDAKQTATSVVDLFTLRMSPRTVFWLEVGAKSLTLLYVAVFTWRTFLRAIVQTSAGEVWQAGTTHLPVWPSRWMLPIAGFFMALYLAAAHHRPISRARSTSVSLRRAPANEHAHARARSASPSSCF